MHRVFILLLAFYIVACFYEGAKVFNEGDYRHYPFTLSHALLTPLFAVIAYVSVVIISRVIIPAKLRIDIFVTCIMIPAVIANFLAVGIIDNFPKFNPIQPLFMFLSLAWMFIPGFIFDSADFSEHMSLRQHSFGDHFTSELVGLAMIITLPPLAGILAYRGLFLADSALDKVFGWIIAHCSVLLLAMAFFVSTLVQMCKVEKDIIYLTWTRGKIISTFLPSMIRNSVLQAFVYPGCILTFMATFDSSYFTLCFKLYCICFVFVFRVFPSFNWAPCLNGIPRKHTSGSLSDWDVFELAISNNYTWLLAFASTLFGCVMCSFLLGVSFSAALFSLESLHAYIICRFLGTRIHAKSSITHRMTPFPLRDKASGKYVLPHS